ncbi:unnamed protein product [Adineta steineri]|uniref:Uncharacterized protein n=1 Tax=Adineta steineri TaxID=433720 RepID=A0A814IZ84_9BILA|nr:unnamed protein product [Adineta steineri]CAF1029088.1 unnamed protein product [Adineta steineri]CAF3657790.1 unnamed protein product [Adineta steineri]CAF3697989.1 unnamed protein product [Adineta steineri]
MGSKQSQPSINYIAQQSNRFSDQRDDYEWFIQHYPGGIRHDSYDERIVVTTFPTNLTIEDFDEYIDRKFSDLNADNREKMKTLIKVNLDPSSEYTDASPSEENGLPLNNDEYGTTESSRNTTAENHVKCNKNKTPYFSDNEKMFSVNCAPNGRTTATLIEILFEKSSQQNEYKISIGYIKLSRMSKNGSHNIDNYWIPNQDRITKALQYKYGKQLKRELKDGF